MLRWFQLLNGQWHLQAASRWKCWVLMTSGSHNTAMCHVVWNFVTTTNCVQEGYRGSFSTVNIRHVNAFHRCECSAPPVDVDPTPLTTYDGNDDTCLSNGMEHFVPPSLNDVESEAVSLVCELCANTSIPHNIVPRVIQSFNNMAYSLTKFVHPQFLPIA